MVQPPSAAVYAAEGHHPNRDDQPTDHFLDFSPKAGVKGKWCQ